MYWRTAMADYEKRLKRLEDNLDVSSTDRPCVPLEEVQKRNA